MQKIARKIFRTLKTFKEVEAVSIGGSHAHGCADEYSDYDIYVFYRGKMTPKSERKKVLHKLADFEKAFTRGHLDYFIFKGKHIHTWWVDINDTRKKLKQHDVDAKFLVRSPRIVWDRRGKLRELRKSVKFPAWLVKKTCTWGLVLTPVPKIFSDVAEKSVKRGRPFFAEWSIYNQTENIIKVIYAFNREYYPHYPQHLQCHFKQFKHVPRNALKNINRIGRYSLVDNPREKLTALYELYWATVDMVRTKYKYQNADLFPEYEDKKWFKKRIEETVRAISHGRKIL